MGHGWDVVVVGAGPAGASAAAVLARAGQRVLVLDRKRVVGEPNHCGEAVSADCLEEAALPPPQPFVRREVPGCVVEFPNGAVLRFPRRGYCIDRPAFDRALAERARSAGAEVRTGCGVVDVESAPPGWSVRTRWGVERARYLVGAGGARCPVARRLGEATPFISAMQLKFRAEDVPEELASGWLRFYQHEEFPGGYGWAFPRGGEVAVGAGGPGGARRRTERLCRRLGIDPALAIDRSGGPLPFPLRPPRLVHDRAVLCGDAGAFLSPLTKGGVLGAVWSGRLAGEAVARALATGEGELAWFADAVRRHPSRSARQLAVPHAFFRFDNRILDTIGRVMDGRSSREVPVLRCLGELVRQPRRRIWWGIGVALAVRIDYHRAERFAW